MHKELCECWCL